MRPRCVPHLVLALFAAACVPAQDTADTASAVTSASTTASTGSSEGHDGTAGSSGDSGATASTDAADTSSSITASASSQGASSDTSASTDATASSSDDSASAGSTTGAPPPACDGIGDCERCGAVEGCGWCGATGTCAAGDATGPAGGSCSGGWVIEGDFFSCPAADCFAQTNCADCQDFYSGCGWCASNGTCMPGAPDMPAPGGQCEDQQWYFDICPEDCGDEMTCISCTGTVGCGWCDASNTCMAGTDAGPLQQACGGGWSTSPNSCF